MNPNRQSLWDPSASWAIPLVVALAMALVAATPRAAAATGDLIGGNDRAGLGEVRAIPGPSWTQRPVHTLVETVIMPNVDFRGMTARASGPSLAQLPTMRRKRS